MIKDRADGIFWNLEQHIQKNQVVNGAIYVIGREQACQNPTLIKDLINSNNISIVYSNPSEGSESMEWQLIRSGLTELLATGQVLLVTGGNVNPAYPHVLYENYLGKVHDYAENLEAIQEYADKQQPDRPYKFLFLNGRMRGHRKELIHKFQQSGLINQSLWTNLDDSNGVGPMKLTAPPNICCRAGTFPVRYLPAEYEIERYKINLSVAHEVVTGPLNGKHNLFQRQWGEIYLNSKTYLDTYFSLVTETVFDYPRSFRTEKIWKPIAIGHPFVAVSGRGYYQDLHDLGFKTFGHLIDESFDSIENNQARCDRIAEIVEDLCRQDLPAFITAAEEVCKYNQLLMIELRSKVREEFPNRFFQAIDQQFNE